MEMKLWRASEADVRAALTKDIEEHGERSRFVGVGEDEFALRSWKADWTDSDCEITAGAFSFRQAGQYQGAGVLTGFGLRLRHLAQR
jgi:hypothetical protein